MSEFFNSGEEIDKHRHNLPHWQQGDTWIFLTYRLADSLPKARLITWQEERSSWLAHHPEPWSEATELEYHHRFSMAIDQWLDQGHGSCLLKNPENAQIVARAFQHFDGDRYKLGPYVVMPNHVHLLFQPLGDRELPELVHSWKRFTASVINQQEGRRGSLWQADYWDRLIRSRGHFQWTARYIARNPERLPAGTYLLGP